MRYVAGVDGCPGGWIAVMRPLDGAGPGEILVTPRFADILAGGPAIVAVDMPIGLPERIGPGGRGPEKALRARLGERQSSVFAVPSRAAVYAPDYGAACALAAATSDPPRKVSKQAFFLFPKIREIDALLRADAALRERVFESHPEGVFMVLNGGRPLAQPKKVKSRPWPAGLDERRILLAAAGVSEHLTGAMPPRGSAADDLLDACACSVAALRIAAGVAVSFPPTPGRDEAGLPVAIWA